MSQFEQFAMTSGEAKEAPQQGSQGVRETFKVMEERDGKMKASPGTVSGEEKGQEVSDVCDVSEEEATDAVTISEDESFEVIEDDVSDDNSKENVHKSRNTSSSRPSRAAKNKSFNYRVDAEDIDVDLDAERNGMQGKNELEDSEDDGPREGIYVDSSSDGEGPSEEEQLIIQEAKTGLKNVECILWQRRSPDIDGVKEMRVKFIGTSYRKTQWVDREDLIAVGKQAMVRGYDRRLAQGKVDPYNDMEDGIHPEWCVVERVLAEREHPVNGEHQYLVKWCDLGYSESTWESSDSLLSDEDLAAITKFKTREELEAKKAKQKPAVDMPAMDMSSLPKFCNGRELRDYQKESLKWMSKNWYDGKNCILGDEMGLGKTAQSIACLEFQRQFGKIQDPFLIIAPLTTLGHWKREIETWTDMNCVLYCGNAKDKAVINEYELYCQGSRVIKPDVVLSSFEHVMKDAELFQGIDWETMVIDEAHRMKGTKSATRTTIAGIPCQWILLLTGTPVQNNIKELFGILNLLDDSTFADEDEFLDKYGRSADKMTPEQVVALQQQLKPLLLRRMKEDVETLPEKEECVIWVELTKEQRAYYKAIFANQIGTLLGGGSTENAPMLRNVAMELRKVCNHPFLCDGVEEDYAKRTKEAAALASSADGEGGSAKVEISDLDLLVSACGKMQLLHKLLPKLRQEKRKVLIFSQFKMMLDVLEDYAHNMSYPVERIDGSTASKERQAAIDRFSNDDKDGFIFLLSTKAGGQGITLTAADTCILYDSDWNPQNDLQAMARCHRIGQSKDVTIYRLVSKNTYEENLFRTSSKKYGLDEAILGGLGSLGVVPEGGGNPEYDGARIAALLKHGAHCLKDEDKANEETDAFLSEDIDQILKARTEKRQIGGRAGNTFSVATFGEQTSTPGKGGKNDEEFWKSLLPDAVASHEKAKEMANQLHVLPPRRRTTVNYSEKRRKRRSSDDDFVIETGDGGRVLDKPRKKSKPKNPNEPPGRSMKKWSLADLNRVLDGLLRFGMDLDRFQSSSNLTEALAQKKLWDASQTMEAVRYVKGVWESLGPVAPEKPPSTTYSHEEGASEEFLQRKDEEIRIKRAKYQAQVTELLGNMANSFSTRVAGLLALDVPMECIESFSDPKFFMRIIENAAAMTDHLDALQAIQQRVVEKEVKLPKVDYKGTPDFWNKQLIYNNDDSNDRHVLKRVYELGWEFSQRRSKDQEDTLMSIIRSDEFFGPLRAEFLGSTMSPPTSSKYITNDQWNESPDFGYKQLVMIVYRRVKAYMVELTRLLRVQRDLLRARGSIGPPLTSGSVKNDSFAPSSGVPKLQTGMDSMLTPKNPPSAGNGGETSVLNGGASGSKLAFSGPPPSGKAGHGPAPALKHASKQMDLFAAFKVSKK